MATTIFKGFGYFLGGFLGLVTLVVGFLIIWYLLQALKKARIKKQNMPRILLEYRKTLLKKEKFEEYTLIGKYLKDLKKNKIPKELAERYDLDVDSSLCWVTGDDGDEHLRWKYSHRILFKPNLKKNESKNQNSDSKSDSNTPDSDNKPKDANSDSETEK